MFLAGEETSIYRFKVQICSYCGEVAIFLIKIICILKSYSGPLWILWGHCYCYLLFRRLNIGLEVAGGVQESEIRPFQLLSENVLIGVDIVGITVFVLKF